MDNDVFRNAYGLHQAGLLAEAARAYGEVLAANPRQFEALFLLGVVHLQTSRFDEAERILSRAVAVDPQSADAHSARATAFQQMGRHADALISLDSLLALKPDHAIAWNNRGNALLTLNRCAEAIASYDRAIALKLDYAEAWHNRAVARIVLQDYPEAESDLNRALSLRPDYPDALEHRGIALAAQGRHHEALSSYDAANNSVPGQAELICRRADCFLHLERFAEALADYDCALAIAPADSDAWHNRGVVLSRLGRITEALESYDQALRLRPDFAESWHNRGSALLALKHHAEALASYDRALAARPDYAEAWKSRGTVLVLLQRYGDALAAFDSAIRIRTNDAGAWEGRGNALLRLQRNEEALASYDEALRLQPGKPDVLYNRASVLSLLEGFRESAEDCEALLAIEPSYPYARGLLILARLHRCEWRDLRGARNRIAEDLADGRHVIHPFDHLAISGSPDEQLRCARILVENQFPASLTPLSRGARYRHDRIRIAYLSADFYAHATAFLMAGVFEHHDRTRFETYAVSFGPNDKSAMRARLERGFDRFLDVRDESDSAIAAKLREMEVDIAVDLKGYTRLAKPGILARRPAPLQVHYLGYPGTMGADYIDYLLADRVVIPEHDRAFYAEQIVYLPGSYQCNDSARRVSVHTPSRADAGLPEAGFVFCCFNSNYKIMPEIFDIWMRLLAETEGSVLWLFQENADAATNLRREAEARGISSGRLIFAERTGLEHHLARLKLADLVLDTLPYGAHTTASDALWVGVPVLSALGSTFAGRVAASLLNAIGVPELSTPSLEAYEDQAKKLACNPAALAAIRAKLLANRDTHPLFHTPRFTHHLEAAYLAMWERQQRGLPPAGFVVDVATAAASQ